jgi:ArsR family transcriptional regulator
MIKEGLDRIRLQKASEVLRALAHPLRLRIMQFIDENKSVNVNRIYKNLDLEQSITSQHLRILRNTNIVNTRREGKYIHYEINYSKLGSNVKSIRHFMGK